jgi:(p)ppGpp synthase/HD superfamily hydrolase
MLSSRFEDAMVFAAQLHSEQVRKGSKTPYIAHLMATASLVLENGGGEDEAIAALLHDAIEDQGGKRIGMEIRMLFGEKVAGIVEACSDADTIPKPPWRGRKEAYLERLKSASPSVILVSMADKLHNARSLLRDYRRDGATMWDKFNGGKDGTLWYYRSLVEIYQPNGSDSLVNELELVVTELEKLTALE